MHVSLDQAEVELRDEVDDLDHLADQVTSLQFLAKTE